MARREMTRKNRILDAALGILRRGGTAALTTRAVAEAAGVQPPAIYRQFGDKEGLLRAAAEHGVEAYVSAKAGKPRLDDPVADLEAGWNEHIAFCLANPALFALMNEVGSPATAAGRSVVDAKLSCLADAGRLRVPSDLAALVLHAIGTGAILEIIEGPRDARSEALIEILTEAAFAAIIVTDPGGGPSASSALRTVAAMAERSDLLTVGERMLLGELLDRLSESAQA